MAILRWTQLNPDKFRSHHDGLDFLIEKTYTGLERRGWFYYLVYVNGDVVMEEDGTKPCRFFKLEDAQRRCDELSFDLLAESECMPSTVERRGSSRH